MDRTLRPTFADTEVLDAHSWRPRSFDGLLSECQHAVKSARAAEGGGRTVLFRGQADAAWGITSTFSRSAAGAFDQSDPWYGNRLHQALIDNFCPTGVVPSAELLAKCDADMDPWFELMKRIQQHPEEFAGSARFAGTNLIDWSRSSDVAMAFASSEFSEKEGVLYLLDTIAAGPVLVQRPVREILDLMSERLVDGDLPGGPLLFCPRRQIAYERVKRQSPFYLAQMDLRYPIEHVWRLQEGERSDGQLIFRRLLLTPAVKQEAVAYLASHGISVSWLLVEPVVG